MRPNASVDESPGPLVEEAKRVLGVRRLAFAIHDASLPGDPDEDLGRGAPTSRASLRLLAFVRSLGFDAIQLGPQGLTGEGDPSPYRGCLFSRDPLSIALGRLADPDEGDWGGWLPRERLARLVAARPPGGEQRMPYAAVVRAQREALGEAFGRFERGLSAHDPRARSLAERLERFGRQARPWLEPDALYELLRADYGGCDWWDWQGPRAELDRSLGDPDRRDASAQARAEELTRRQAPALRFYRFVQGLAHAQHERFRSELAGLGMRIYGDLHVGVSARDAWRWPGIWLAGYRLGAPPSRTNPEGQPWGQPLLDPDAYGPETGEPGPALRFVDARLEKMFAEYDAVRIDHPQGLVCPWVYRSDEPDPLLAVQQGARLFSSPDLPDHPALARYAIVRREQLAGEGTPRYDDHWVQRLEEPQVDRYGRVFDRVADLGRRLGGDEPALICEVLSTLPHPLERVLLRHGLGRFRVTQKADPDDPRDVYRPECAASGDWVMFGTHDTPPLWQLLDTWRKQGRTEARAAAAAECLAPSPEQRRPLREALVAEPGLLAHAEVARLFASPAEQVSIFFADLFGSKEVYNRPGTVSSENWTLRLAPDWSERYAEQLREDRALNLPLALWLALRARPTAPRELTRALRERAERVRRGPPLP